MSSCNRLSVICIAENGRSEVQKRKTQRTQRTPLRTSSVTSVFQNHREPKPKWPHAHGHLLENRVQAFALSAS